MKSGSCQVDEKRPTRAVEELHQIAATRTERRLCVKVDCRRFANKSRVGPPGTGPAFSSFRRAGADHRCSQLPRQLGCCHPKCDSPAASVRGLSLRPWEETKSDPLIAGIPAGQGALLNDSHCCICLSKNSMKWASSRKLAKLGSLANKG